MKDTSYSILLNTVTLVKSTLLANKYYFKYIPMFIDVSGGNI